MTLDQAKESARRVWSREDVTPEIVRALLDHDPATGLLTWKLRDRKWFSKDQECRRWNTRYANKPAFASSNSEGYKKGYIFRREFKAHRVGFAHFYGRWPDGEVDHINGVRDDNRISNLRDVAPGVNQRNCRRRSDNTSGVTGVSWHDQNGKWACQIASGSRPRASYFDTKDEAIAARKAAEREFGYHPNHGRKS